MIAESVIIGILAGGWASATYWPGEAGMLVGVGVGLAAWVWLAVRRENRKERRGFHEVRR